jgi:hypothetical protein
MCRLRLGLSPICFLIPLKSGARFPFDNLHSRTDQPVAQNSYSLDFELNDIAFIQKCKGLVATAIPNRPQSNYIARIKCFGLR